MSETKHTNLARKFALEAGKNKEHSYLPKTEDEALAWTPHAWVIKALEFQNREIIKELREMSENAQENGFYDHAEAIEDAIERIGDL